MHKTALLVVDVQEALVEGHPYREEEFLGNLQQLLAAARGNGVEVVYVRHDGGAGDELEAGSPGWRIHRAVSPEPGEKIFDKTYNSAFKSTGLKDYLDGRGISRIFLAGMQTEYCIDATCKAAFEYGFSLVVPSGATTTFKNEYLSGEKLVEFYERKIWNGRFAEVVPVREAVGEIGTPG